MKMDLVRLSLWLVLVLLPTDVWGQQVDGCPRDWLDHDGSCYRFVEVPQLTFQDADLACRRKHSTLLRVDSAEKNTYVNNWFMSRGTENRKEWITSGVKKGGRLVWTSDGSDFAANYNNFLADTETTPKVDHETGIEHTLIIYKYEETENAYTWNWGRTMKLYSYVCEMPKSDLWKLYAQDRDFSFGTGMLSPEEWPVAPKITEQSGDTLFFMRTSGSITPVDLQCYATGNPQPTYRWIRQYLGEEPEVIPSDSSHHTITNGRLKISYPKDEIDVGVYYCEASNKHGTVISNPIQLSYGQIGEFPPIRTNNYNSKLYMGVELDCQPPDYKPDAKYNWFKESIFRAVRTDLNHQMFVSQNGRLYISEVYANDAGNYFCAVHLAARPGETLASGQTVSRQSMDITLTVQGDNANTYGPDIQDKFPQVFPRVPLVGQRLMIECLAYGRLPLVYDWVREDAPMNPKAYKTDLNRILIIEEALLQDTGRYTCVVSGERATNNRTRYVQLSGVPSFPLPLSNQFLDVGKPFTWTCFSQGVPIPTYSWYKDGKRLEATNPYFGISVRGKHLTFQSVNETHNGVYECEAENSHGIRRSSAQLRAVSFEPSFVRNPVVSRIQATVGSSVTIQCLPEAAPRPVITWTREGGGALGGSGVVLPNGALEFKELGMDDGGTYVCGASNDLGEASSKVVLAVSDKTVLEEAPQSDEVPVNGSTTLRCKASYDATKSDVIYSWKFYEHVIDYDQDLAYSMPYLDVKDGSGALYVTGAQYEHEGWYECIASTVTDTVSDKALLTVTGPPEEPAGVHKHKDKPDGPHSIEIWWHPGKTHGHPVTTYRVEVKSKYDTDWRAVKDIAEESSKIQMESFDSWRGAVISDGLSPGTSYRFRVRAGNRLVGFGPPSLPSSEYKMDDAAPIYPPPNVGGGGGKERELHVTWDPLPQSQWGANYIRYVAFYRRKDGGRIDGKWEQTEELKTTEFHVFIDEEYYYLPYEVKVRAVNGLGAGPNSSIVEVMSAELMPELVPEFAQTYAINSTAGTVEWKQVSNTRESVKGSIFAFQVNYWLEDSKCLGVLEHNAMFTRVYGDVTSANVIGLVPGEDYCVNIQLLNHAGLAPKTNNYWLGMNDAAPQGWPEYVTVSSHGPESVRVLWRGVVNRFGESPLQGYKAWYWTITEDIRAAKKVDFGRDATGVIHGIEKNMVYRLRMVAYSAGGDGKKAPDVLFTLGGRVAYNVQSTEVMNAALRPSASISSLFLTFVLFFVSMM